MNFRIARQFIDAKQYVFLDESVAQTNMTRRYGWAPTKHRCHDAAPHGHWKTSILISAIGYQGVLPSATLLLDGTMNAETFDGYRLLVSQPPRLSAEQHIAFSIRGGQGPWSSSHQMTINGRRDHFTLDDFYACGKTAMLKKSQVKKINNEVQATVSHWLDYAQEVGVSSDHIRKIQPALRLNSFA